MVEDDVVVDEWQVWSNNGSHFVASGADVGFGTGKVSYHDVKELCMLADAGVVRAGHGDTGGHL